MLNKANINRLIDWIKQDQGSHLKMTHWFQSLTTDLPVITYEPCNTAFCLGGYCYILMLKDDGMPEKDWKFPALGGNISLAAGDFLGLSGSDMRHDLFSMHSSKFFIDDFDNLPQPQRAASAIKVLEILRDEGIVDWDSAINETR